MRLTLDTKIAAPVYVTHYLQTSFVKSQIQVLAKDAVNQASINQEDVKGLIYVFPRSPYNRNSRPWWSESSVCVPCSGSSCARPSTSSPPSSTAPSAVNFNLGHGL